MVANRLLPCYVKKTDVQCSLSKVRNCAVPPDHLRSEIALSRTCNIQNLLLYMHCTGLKRFAGCVYARLRNSVCTKKILSVKFS